MREHVQIPTRKRLRSLHTAGARRRSPERTDCHGHNAAFLRRRQQSTGHPPKAKMGAGQRLGDPLNGARV